MSGRLLAISDMGFVAFKKYNVIID